MYQELGDRKEIKRVNTRYVTLMWIFYLAISIFLSAAIPQLLFRFVNAKKIIIENVSQLLLLVSAILLAKFSNIDIKIILKPKKFININFIFAVLGNFFVSCGLLGAQKCSVKSYKSIIDLVFICLLPPICEEVLFRGWLLKLTRKTFGKIGSVIVTSLCFAIAHHNLSLSDSLLIFIYSLWWCFVQINTKTIYSSIFLHFLHNSTIALTKVFPQYACGYSRLTSIFMFAFGGGFCFLYEYCVVGSDVEEEEDEEEDDEEDRPNSIL